MIVHFVRWENGIKATWLAERSGILVSLGPEEFRSGCDLKDGRQGWGQLGSKGKVFKMGKREERDWRKHGGTGRAKVVPGGMGEGSRDCTQQVLIGRGEETGLDWELGELG